MAGISVRALLPGGDPDRLFSQLERFEDYPSLAESCRAVSIIERDGDKLISSWEVNFRNGILKWQERDVIDRANRRVRFTQTQGDLASFEGSWEVTDEGTSASVRFNAEFDLGIPSLASMLHPVAERALRTNLVEAIRGVAEAVGTPVGEIETDGPVGPARPRATPAVNAADATAP